MEQEHYNPCVFVEVTNRDMLGNEHWSLVSGAMERKNKDFRQAAHALLVAMAEGSVEQAEQVPCKGTDQ